MIKKIPLTYNEIDEQADMITRMITAIAKEVEMNEFPKTKKKKIYYNYWYYDEPTYPVISPERYWWFL